MRHSTSISGSGPERVTLYEGSSLKLNQAAEEKARQIMTLTLATGTLSVHSAGSTSIYIFENGVERRYR